MAPVASATPSRVSHPARDLCLAPGRTIDAPVVKGGRYGRMFPDLPAAAFDEVQLLALGIDGGVCDGSACDTDSHIEAGQPFFRQYLAHDITADRSPLRAHMDINALRNVRSPRANLEALYGGGPVGSPYLIDQRDPAKLLPGSPDCDLPRNQQGIALIGDPRNDVHAFMTGLQVAFIRAHNRLVDRLRSDGVAESDLFEDARLALNWHYQWVILHDLRRGQGTGLRSGEAVAGAMGVPPLTHGELALRSWQGETPLWLYILREAAARGGGDHLGEVGGRIVAEVIVGIIRNDPESYLSNKPSWRPTLPSHQAGVFKIR